MDICMGFLSIGIILTFRGKSNKRKYRERVSHSNKGKWVILTQNFNILPRTTRTNTNGGEGGNRYRKFVSVEGFVVEKSINFYKNT